MQGKTFVTLFALVFLTIVICNVSAFQVVVKSSNLVVTPGSYSWILGQSVYPIQMNVYFQTRGLTVTPYGNVTDPNVGGKKQVNSWNWGDHTPVQSIVGGLNNWLSHTYSAPGTYLVTMTVVDSLGNTNTDSQLITVPSSTTYTKVSNSLSISNATWAPTVVGFTNQPMYVIGIGQHLYSAGYTPYSSKMLLFYAPFNNTFNQSVVYTFYSASNTFTISQAYLKKPGLYRVSGPLVVNNVTINQTSQWIALYDQSQLPAPLRQSFSNATLLSFLAASNYTVLLNKTVALNHSIQDLQAKLVRANSSIALLLNQTRSSGRELPILGFVSNADIVSLGISLLVLLALIIFVFLKNRDKEDEIYSWDEKPDKGEDDSFLKKKDEEVEDQEYGGNSKVSSEISYTTESSKSTSEKNSENIETGKESQGVGKLEGLDADRENEDFETFFGTKNEMQKGTSSKVDYSSKENEDIAEVQEEPSFKEKELPEEEAAEKQEETSTQAKDSVEDKQEESQTKEENTSDEKGKEAKNEGYEEGQKPKNNGGTLNRRQRRLQKFGAKQNKKNFEEEKEK